MNSTAKKCPDYTHFRPIFLMRRSHINGNLYHYGGNNPVRYIDPTGRASILQRPINKGQKWAYNTANWFGKNLGFFLHGLIDYGDLSSTNSVSQYSGENLGITTTDSANTERNYKIIYTGMDDALTKEAVKIVNNLEEFGNGDTRGLANGGDDKSAGGKYKIFFNDCNDYTAAVFKEYKRLWKEKYKNDNPEKSWFARQSEWRKHKKEISAQKGDWIEIPKN